MEKKPFWRRVNRGFVVSMALLAVVIVYVIVTYIMSIYARQDIRNLAEDFRGLMESTSQLSEEEIQKLQNDTALTEETARLKTELSSLFVDDPDYLDAAVAYLTANITEQTDGLDRITSRSAGKLADKSCNVDQDVGTCSIVYTYTSSGQFMNYSTEQLEEKTDITERLYVTITCKKVNGEWKIYRVSQAYINQISSNTVYGG